MEITDGEFKHFRTFLKSNGIYKEFMECFREQKYQGGFGIDAPSQLLPNYMNCMREYAKSKKNSYENFGTMIFTFASFNWVNGGNVPLPFTRKWCTINLKWAIYCKINNLDIGDDNEIKRVVVFWNDKGWIDPYLLSRKERVFIRSTFHIDVINGINIITEID